MDRFDRIFDLHKLLSASRQPVSRQRVEEELECSRATAKRIIEAMRLYLNAPIKYDRVRNGYYYDHSEAETGAGKMYELPGVWFNASELHALLSVQQLLSDVQPGLLEKQLAPLSKRIENLLQLQGNSGKGLQGRIKILRAAARPAGPCFQQVADALARQQRIDIEHLNRRNDQRQWRQVSPQRLVHYKDNWYLDAYCHLREALRTFALDAITITKAVSSPSHPVEDSELGRHFGSAYGIFSGHADQTATLRFSTAVANWVAHEQWHQDQQGEWLADGRYLLKIPYHQSTELAMDILKYGPNVEVLGPDSLRQEIKQQLTAAAALYSGRTE
ncbi:MAG: WYL domain-containing protein [Chromatiales bacterium]|nr:WYL domain-containing protein [Chromatiales bacterium]